MASFEIAEPRSLDEALDLLDHNDPAIRPIAGQSAQDCTWQRFILETYEFATEGRVFLIPALFDGSIFLPRHAPWWWFGIWLSHIYSLADSDFSEHQRSPFLDGGYQPFNRNLPFLLFVCCSRQLLNVFAGILQSSRPSARGIGMWKRSDQDISGTYHGRRAC